jgi:hypothetical protein
MVFLGNSSNSAREFSLAELVAKISQLEKRRQERQLRDDSRQEEDAERADESHSTPELSE